MKQLSLLLLVVLLCVSTGSAQWVLNKFETAGKDSLFSFSTVSWNSKNDGYMRVSDNAAVKKDGAAAMKVEWKMRSTEGWGSFLELGYDVPRTGADSGKYMNLSGATHLKLWYYNKVKSSKPDSIHFRITLHDGKTNRPENNYWQDKGWREDWLYENSTMMDSDTGWKQLSIPLTDLGKGTPNDQGFSLPDWAYNNQAFNYGAPLQLDLDKIVGYSLIIVAVSGFSAPDTATGEIYFDNLSMEGSKYPVLDAFDDKAPVANYFKIDNMSWDAGNKGQVLLTDEKTDKLEGTSSLKVQYRVNATQGWGGYVNFEHKFDTPLNLAGRTSLQLFVKNVIPSALKDTIAGKGVSRLAFRFVLYDDSQSSTESWFTLLDLDPLKATDWKLIEIPLETIADQTWELKPGVFANPPGQGNQDGVLSLSKIGGYKFEYSINGSDYGPVGSSIIAEGTMLFDYMLPTGYKETDVTPPAAPTGITVIGSSFQNLITWSDVPNEAGSYYNVFFNDKPWTDQKDAAVEDLPPYDIPIGTRLANHILRAPNTDQNITYYYGVVATDRVGNVGAPGFGSAVTTKAKGVPTISKTAPANFKADASLSEWASITPIELSKDKQTAHVNPSGIIESDNDLSVKAYLAMDSQNLYVAFDVIDDVVNVDTTMAETYAQDSPDLFISLYDWRGKRHAGYKRGATPDYHLRFSLNKLLIDNDNGGVITWASANNPNYIWKKKTLTSGYVVEAKIPFADIATNLNDQVFVPAEGMRIPIDFSINDRDNKTFSPNEPWNARDGILCYSALNDDNSWQDMWRWTHTWIGDKWTVTSVEQVSEVPHRYELTQNYPNPFNPSTQIRYSLEKAGMVSLKVYDLIGREVVTLVNGYQEAGSYIVTFNTSEYNQALSTGVYFYRIESGSYTAIQKMLLLK